MGVYKIITDMTADLPEDYCKKNNIDVINLSFIINDKEYDGMSEMTIEEFYKLMREGKMTKTSQPASDVIEERFRKYLDDGVDFIYYGFSSALSGTYSAAAVIVQKLVSEYPDRKMYAIDTLCASLGEGMLVMKAVENAAKGMPIEELYRWSLENRGHVVHLFTVDDLMFLHRGGRVSKTAAVAGSLLGIKPVLHVSDDGRLLPVKKVRGRKQSLNEIVEMMGVQMGSYENDFITISHGDCIEDAKYVASEVKKKYGIKKCTINHVGAVVGSHSGPGTIALFFMGEVR